PRGPVGFVPAHGDQSGSSPPTGTSRVRPRPRGPVGFVPAHGDQSGSSPPTGTSRVRPRPPPSPHHTTKGVRPRIGGRTPFVSARGSVAGEATVGHAVGARGFLTEALDLVGLVALEVALVPVPG